MKPRMAAIWALLCALEMAGCGPSRAEREASLTLGLVAPVNVKMADIYKDGGTLSLKVEDAKGTLLSFCHEGVYGEGGGPKGGAMKVYHSARLVTDPSEPLHLYMGIGHPSDPGGQLVPAGENVDRALSTILRSWLNRNYSKAEQKRLRESTSAQDRTQSQWQGIHVISWLSTLDGRIAQGKERVSGIGVASTPRNN